MMATTTLGYLLEPQLIDGMHVHVLHSHYVVVSTDHPITPKPEARGRALDASKNRRFLWSTVDYFSSDNSMAAP